MKDPMKMKNFFQRDSRVWYLPKEWAKIQEQDKTNKDKGWSELLENWKSVDSWEDVIEAGWDEIKKFPHILLSRSPLTFGHSQLVIPAPFGREQAEEKFFEWGSEIIKRAIVVFRKVFREKEIHKEPEFSNLSEMTFTYGKYIKTLILKSSANENVSEKYKIHLVPYFESHDKECQKRFHARHRVLPNKKGGLLGWLGEREDEVDKWEVDYSPCKDRLDVIANCDLNMLELAKRLQREIQKIR